MMARVYLDGSALYLRWSDTRRAVLAPDAQHAVELLRNDGHEVYVVGSHQPAGSWADRLPLVDEPVPEGDGRSPGWLIVGDRARCGSRFAGLLTVLVGGGPVPHTGRGRCDMEVSDLRRAALAVIGAAAGATS
jgi:hypothetical protein